MLRRFAEKMKKLPRRACESRVGVTYMYTGRGMARVERRFGGRTGVMPGRDRLACSPTGRLHSVHRRSLPGSPGTRPFSTFCPRRAPVVPRPHAGMLADKSSDACRPRLPSPLLARHDSLITRMFPYRLPLAVRTMTPILHTDDDPQHAVNGRLACISLRGYDAAPTCS